MALLTIPKDRSPFALDHTLFKSLTWEVNHSSISARNQKPHRDVDYSYILKRTERSKNNKAVNVTNGSAVVLQWHIRYVVNMTRLYSSIFVIRGTTGAVSNALLV